MDDCPRDRPALQDWQQALARMGRSHTVDGLKRSITRHERWYGLHTDDFKCLYKFELIFRGHRRFFAALAAWVQAGGSVLYVKGNHDVEQHWTLIRRAFRDFVHRAGADAQRAAERVFFSDEHWAVQNVYIEHGHQFEWITAVPGSPELVRPAGRLRLPLGSLVNRHIINQLERIEPFLDNIKPVTDMLWPMLRRRPLSVFKIIRRGSWLLARSLIQRRFGHALLAGAILVAVFTYLVPLLVVLAIVLALGWPGFADWLRDLPLLDRRGVPEALSVLGVLFPFLVGVVRGLWRRFRRPALGEDRFAERLHRKLAAQPGVQGAWRTQYGVLGHTHHQDVQELPPVVAGGGPMLYLNSGTWAPLWPLERPDLIGRTLYSFIRFALEEDEYTHESLLWDDVARRPRQAVLLTPEASRAH